MELGYKLKKIRESKKYSQQEIAVLLCVSQKTYSNFESCKSKPSLVQLCKLSIILEFDLLQCLNELGIPYYKDRFEDPIKMSEASKSNNLQEILIKKNHAQLKDKDEIIFLLKEKIHALKHNIEKNNKV